VTQLSTSRIPGGFTEKTARVNGVTLNYATGGTGPAVVLLHGYPVLAIGGEGALGQAIPDQMQLYAGDVTRRRVPLRSLGRGGKPGNAAQAPAAVPRLARRAREGTSTPGGQDEHH
jgi:hypothetical protein